MSSPKRDTLLILDARKVIRLGHSVALTLPPAWLRHAGVLPGDLITTKIDYKTSALTIRKSANGPRHADTLNPH